jgi:prepilin peptidase CpaA
MSTYGLLMAAPAVAMLLIAAATDLRDRRIPNWLTFSLILSGVAQSIAFPGVVTTPWESLGGFGVGFALTFALFAMGAVGGGDVKLLAGLGAWFGPLAAFQLFCVEAVVGMVIVLAQAAAQGRTRTLLRNSAVLAVNLAHVGDVGVAHVKATGQSSRSVERPLPYAVPVLVALLILLAANWR